MKQFLSLSFFVRLLSPVFFPVLLVIDLLLHGSLEPASLCLDLWLAVLVLLLCPSAFEPASSALPFIAFLIIMSLALKLLDASVGLCVVCGSAVMMAYAMRKTALKYSDIPPLFHVSGVWKGIEDYMYLLHLGLCLCAGMVIPLLGASRVLAWSWLAVLTGVYAAQFLRVSTHRTLFIGKQKEEQIRRFQRGSAFREPVSYIDSESRSACLFNEVVKIMETRRPWLQDDFGVDDLARMARTNRMYLSKTINFHAGRNFNQMVKYYRVRYALELIRKDPGLKINELSQMCGFHTVVSFNSAFKLNQRMTPTEYIQSIKKLS